MRCSIHALLKKACLFLAIPVLMADTAQAQYAAATQYPFVATTAGFQYLVGGTTVTGIHTDDAQATNIPIGFSFPFCGNSYTTGSVSSNLWFSLSTTTAIGTGINNDNSNFNQFSGNNSLPVIMPFWDDWGWAFGGNASYLTTGTAPNRVFTFEWKNWVWDFSLPAGTLSIQMKLYENGSIQFLYKREHGAIGSQLAITTGWFGGSIGIARTTTDFQFLDGSTMFSKPSTTSLKGNIEARPFSEQSYMWLAPCTDMQSAAIEGPQDACPGKPFLLAAVARPTIGTNTACNWSYSDNGVSYVPLTGGTGVISDVITKPRWYKATITCGSVTITTPAKKVDVSPHYECYCNSSATTTNAPSAMDIGKVNLVNFKKDTLLNNYDASLGLSSNLYAVKAYTDFTQEFKEPVEMYRDSSYIVIANAISWGTYVQSAVSAYIDFNHNSIFDAHERIMFRVAQNVQPTPGQVADTFTIPDSAKVGITRMRVILRSGTSLPDSCNTYADGETEDYLVNITYPPCNGPSIAGAVISEDTSMCTGYTYVVTDTTYEKQKSMQARTWQHSADDITWFDVANSANKDTLMRLFQNQSLYYRVRMVCLATDDTTFSNVHRIGLKPGYKCYCHSQANGGMENDSSDIGSFQIYGFQVTDGGTHLANPRAYRHRTDRTDLSPVVMWVDSVYSFHVFHTMLRDQHSDGKITVFMDFNNNHQYDIPEERVYTGFTNVGYHTLISYVTVPNAAIVDKPTGMRVIINNDVSPNIPSDNACGEYTSGETEDYMIYFKRAFNVKVDELKGMEDLILYPNPTSGRFTLRFNSVSVPSVSISVTNVTGQQIWSEVSGHSGGRFMKEIDLGAQARGVYFVEVDAGGIKAKRRVVIQ
ncbi:MAG: hypothetical protein K0R82_2197 [Flavipsychrobacter sp.]|jgi:hypothetical protein|nr:hypothetical protein [Flavipsychrobacter sp.]